MLWALAQSLRSAGIGQAMRAAAYSQFNSQVLERLGEFYARIDALLEADGIVSQALATRGREQKEAVARGTGPRRRRPRSLVGTLTGFLGDRGQSGETGEQHAPGVSRALVNQTLDDLRRDDGRQLLEQVGGRLGDRGAGCLDDESRQIIVATEQLLSASQQDPWHGRQMRQLLRQVQLPLARLALDDPAVLEDASHPVRRLLDNLDNLALYQPQQPAGGLEQRSAQQELQQLLDWLAESGARADLGELSKRVEALLQERQGQFGARTRMVAEGCASAAGQGEARTRVIGMLQQKLGGDVCRLVDRLLRLGWAGLLLQCTLPGKGQAKRLETYGNALQLLCNLTRADRERPGIRAGSREKLIKALRHGFSAYPVKLSTALELVDEIDALLLEGGEPYLDAVKQRVRVDSEYLERLLPLSDQAAPGGKGLEDVPEKWRDAIAGLETGIWLTHFQGPGQVRVINLVWRDEEYRQFVFVDSMGNRTLDCDALELAEGLEQGDYALIEDSGLSMVDRAVNRVLKQTFEQLRGDSDRDALTGLHNRRAYERELQRLLQLSNREAGNGLLICMDMDRFSLVNELCGTEGGDRFLEQVASICGSYLNRKGLLARTGDNEFSILLEACGLEQGLQLAESQRRAVEAYRFSWQGREVGVTLSIGLAEITAQGGSVGDLTQAARRACNLAKEQGRNCCRVFERKAEAFASHQRLVRSVPVIEKALEQNRMVLFAQLISPVFIGDGLEEHHELLLRPLDDKGEPGSPFEFIQAAERYDRMRSVDRWVVSHFIDWAEDQLKRKGADALGHFSLNLSGQSITDPGFGTFLVERLEGSTLPPAQLSFEITETELVTRIGRAQGLMQQLRERGHRFLLDDFGSGYASYSYLRDLPVDLVKIDGIFVKEIHQDSTSRAMVRSITEVAHQMNKRVVAEFVENEAILIALRELEVDYAQGYEIGRPVPLQQLES